MRLGTSVRSRVCAAAFSALVNYLENRGGRAEWVSFGEPSTNATTLACEPCLAGWFANGGDATLASYGIDIEDKWLDYTDMVAS